MNNLLKIDGKKEKTKIITFLEKVIHEQNIKSIVLGLSGGIDSTTAFYLIKEVIPIEKIIVARLSYFPHTPEPIDQVITDLNLPEHHSYYLSIKPLVDAAKKTAGISGDTHADKIRLGNIMARSRMILLYDLAKKHNALVCGTENKSEMLLGYFTRFGDEASDIEPIQHLYKTQIYQLARHLNIPETIIKQAPSANLWEGQTDEGQFGFTYAEADEVLYWFHDKKLSLEEVIKKGYPNAEKIINLMKQNDFKHHVPYSLK